MLLARKRWNDSVKLKKKQDEQAAKSIRRFGLFYFWFSVRTAARCWRFLFLLVEICEYTQLGSKLFARVTFVWKKDKKGVKISNQE